MEHNLITYNKYANKSFMCQNDRCFRPCFHFRRSEIDTIIANKTIIFNYHIAKINYIDKWIYLTYIPVFRIFIIHDCAVHNDFKNYDILKFFDNNKEGVSCLCCFKWRARIGACGWQRQQKIRFLEGENELLVYVLDDTRLCYWYW